MSDTPPTSNPSGPAAVSPAAVSIPAVAATTPPLETLPTADEIDIDAFMKVRLRVAKIEAAELVPKSNKLLKLQVNVGPLGKRQIVSGIAKFYPPETLIGRKIIIVSNLKPAKLMGVESQGMLLAASSEDGTRLVIADPGQDMPEGSVVR